MNLHFELVQEKKRQDTTKVLKLQLDNVQHEIQQLQVENKKMQTGLHLGEEQSAEIQNLHRGHSIVTKK